VDSTSILPSNNKVTPASDNNTPPSDTRLQQNEEIVQKIPVYQEDYSITKETTKSQLYLEKKWINSTKKIEIPIKYEEMFINGREFDSYSKSELVEVFSKIKEKISEVIHPGDSTKDGESANKSGDNSTSKKQYPNDIEFKHKKNEGEYEVNRSLSYTDLDKKEVIPLEPTGKNEDYNQIEVSKDNDNKNTLTSSREGQEDQVIPIWGEQIIIDKKMVKLGEIIIKKSKVSENRKIDVEVRNEKVTVKYPDGNKEEFA
jgi:stress response protein YsnF